MYVLLHLRSECMYAKRKAYDTIQHNTELCMSCRVVSRRNVMLSLGTLTLVRLSVCLPVCSSVRLSILRLTSYFSISPSRIYHLILHNLHLVYLTPLHLSAFGSRFFGLGHYLSICIASLCILHVYVWVYLIY